MTTLKVKDFSCISDAFLEMAPLTVLIGPQASGKSVLSKLLYFCYDTISRPFLNTEFVEKIDVYSKDREEDFKLYFPPHAWGGKDFLIDFEVRGFGVTIARTLPKSGQDIGRLRIKFSEKFKLLHDQYLTEINAFISTQAVDREDGVPDTLSATNRIAISFRMRLEKALGQETPGFLLFIPAGRSFFTSMGKAILAFEEARFLDPLTNRFGRQFTLTRDYGFRPRQPRLDDRLKALWQNKEKMGVDLFGGKIVSKSGDVHIMTKDNRKITLPFLSSGQQELLPLWETSNFYLLGRRTPATTFIEEPEAHLFPSAQSKVVSYLTTFMKERSRLFLTTHSPYVLMKINNLMKADQVGSDERHRPSIERIVPSSLWIKKEEVAAYAIGHNGSVKSIIEDGLIDAEYLDQVSGDLAEEFSQMLEVEHSS